MSSLRTRILGSALFLGLVASPATAGLSKVLDGIGALFQANQILWLLGDTGAEKRFGAILAKFFLMTNRINRDPEMNAWVNSIFDRLSAVAPRRGFKYRIHVIDDNTVNAFALPGGTIFIHKGMLDFADSDDEVACVLGHEIAHVARRHSLQRIRRDAALTMLIQKVFENQDDMQLVGQVATLITGMSFSRKNEDESDAVGMKIALDAGFEPAGATSLWEKMHARYGSDRGIAGWLSTHPAHESRVKNTRKWLADHKREFVRTTGKSYDSRAGGLTDLVVNGSFETGSGALPTGWTVSEGEAAWLAWPGKEATAGTRSVVGQPPVGKSLMLSSTPIRRALFTRPRVLRATVRTLAGRPTFYLGLAALDGAGKVLQTTWAAAEAVRPEARWTEFESAPIDPAALDKRTQSLVVRAYLGRLTGGSLALDDVTFAPHGAAPVPGTPGTPGSPRLAEGGLTPGGSFEDDRNGDRIPDGGWVLADASLDPQRAGRGLASVKLAGRAGPGLTRASVTSPKFPVLKGSTYEVRAMTRGEPGTRTGWVEWVALDAQGRPVPGGPGRLDFRAGDDWSPVRDQLTLDASAPAITHMQVRLGADLTGGQAVWIDAVEVTPTGGMPQALVSSLTASGSSQPAPTRLPPPAPEADPGPDEELGAEPEAESEAEAIDAAESDPAASEDEGLVEAVEDEAEEPDAVDAGLYGLDEESEAEPEPPPPPAKPRRPASGAPR